MAGTAFFTVDEDGKKVYQLFYPTEDLTGDEINQTSAYSTKLTQGAKLIQSELTFLAQTRKHSLFFGNDLGLDLERYLYLLNNQATFNLIKDEIEVLFNKYKKVYLQRIDMRFNDMQRSLSINVEVSMDPDGNNLITIPINVGG